MCRHRINMPLIMNPKSFISTPLIKNTLKLSSSNFLMYLLPLIVTPILSRLYVPEAFGEWGVFSSLLMIINIGIMLGYENAIVKAELKDVANVSFLCFAVTVLITILIILTFQIGSYLRIDFFKKFPSPSLFYICIITSAACSIFNNICNRYEKYAVMSVANIVSGSTQAIARILFGTIFIIGMNGLILGTTISHCIVVCYYLMFIYRIMNNKFLSHISLVGIIHQMKRYKKFPLFDAPSSILAFAAFNLPIIILSAYFSKAEIGCFSIIIQLLLLPMSFIGSAMGRVYYRQLVGRDEMEITSITANVMKLTAVISILPLLFIVLGGDKIIVLFLGEKWNTAGSIALCLALWSFPTILTQPLIPLLRIRDKMNILFLYNILYFVGGIGTILVLVQFTNQLYLILVLYSIACSIAKILLFRSILKLSGVRFNVLHKMLFIWIISLSILAFRLSEVL